MQNPEKYTNKNPFTVPENYFEEFPGRLMARIEEEKSGNQNDWKIISLKPIVSIAAGFLLVFVLWVLLLNPLEKGKVAQWEYSNESPELEYFESMNSNELIEMVLESDLQEEVPEIGITDTELLFEPFEESEIIDAI